VPLRRNDSDHLLQGQASDLTRAFKRHLAERGQTVDWLSRRLVSPSAYINHERVKLGALQARLAHATRTPLNQAGFQLRHLRTRLQNQLPDTRHLRLQLNDQSRRMSSAIASVTQRQRQWLAAQTAQLELLNPQRTLERGYAIVTNNKGQVLRKPSQLQPRSTVTVRLAGGSADVDIAGVQPALD